MIENSKQKHYALLDSKPKTGKKEEEEGYQEVGGLVDESQSLVGEDLVSFPDISQPLNMNLAGQWQVTLVRGFRVSGFGFMIYDLGFKV